MKTPLYALLLGLGACVAAQATNYYVSPNGSDAAGGLSDKAPLANINTALALAQPGDKIILLPGTYMQDVETVRSGTATAPIQIVGAASTAYANANGYVAPAVIKGSGDSDRMFQIRNSYIQLRDVILDGLWGDPDTMAGYREKLLFVHNDDDPAGLKGIVIKHVLFRNAGGECLRFRYFVQNSEVAYSTFQDCGVHDFRFHAGKKNGEAIYIGTAFKQWADGKNPTADPDQSSNNLIHHNMFYTNGNECVDIKEGASGNKVYANICSGQRDSHSAGFSVSGNGNLYYDNVITGNTGAGIRFGSDLKGYGRANQAWNNQILDNQGVGFKIITGPQAKICGNTMSGNALGNIAVASGMGSYSPTANCS